MARTTRRSGILLHPTSLPSPGGIGTLGAAALAFIDQLAEAGQRCWQLLPLGPLSYGNSPYAATSAFAGSPLLIDLEALEAAGWLGGAWRDTAPPDAARVDFVAVMAHRRAALAAAFEGFEASGSAADHAAFAAFCQAEAAWLDDYARFVVASELHDLRAWTEWPEPLRLRHPEALAALDAAHPQALRRARFVQFAFARQWSALREHARARGVELIGDIPIFVALNSADVWANQALFYLDAAGQPTVVAGVPPDYFSETGQRWGNPLYRWDRHAETGFAWWIARLRQAFACFDTVRVDHFRGFAGYWEIPAACPTAVDGRWVPGPGRALFDAAEAALGALPVIAEDLGEITPDVEALRDDLGYPGMKILHFAFGGDAGNPHLPHHHPFAAAVYTGTHDNDTTRGWYDAADDNARAHLWRYARVGQEDPVWGLLALAWSSPADLAVAPAQDLLGLGAEARMNVPGRPDGNWEWRLLPGQLDEATLARLRDLTTLYGRS